MSAETTYLLGGCAGPEPRPYEKAVMTITYKAYIIDAFEREQDRWRATIRRQDGMRIWVAVPPSEHESVTTSADALTAEGAIDLAKQGIDGGGMI